MKEPIDIFFTKEERFIVSDNWELPAILSFRVDRFQNDKLYLTEKQEFGFFVKTSDTLENDLSVGTIFQYEAENYLFTFRIASVAIDDLTGIGLTSFQANFVSKELL